MSYELIVEGYVEVLGAAEGMTPARVLPYEPTSIAPESGEPTMYLLFDRFEDGVAGQVLKRTYFTIARLCFLWVDNEMAEQEVMPFVNRIPAALHATRQTKVLNGRLTADPPYQGGEAKIIGATGVFVIIGGVLYRAIDFELEAFEKFPSVGGGL